MDRALRYVNAAAVLLLLAVVAAVVWFVWRPMPKTSGSLEAGVSAPVTVVRDDLGVPHISAASIEDALFTQGYATAQDRLWQMDAIRRLASGELSEVVGPAALESDREARSLRLRRAAEMHATTMPAADKAMLAAYARGVNDFLDRNRGNLPLEFRLLQYQPRPWSVVDSVAIAMHMYRTLTTTWKDDLLRGEMAKGGSFDKVAALFPVRSGREAIPGSNAWVVSGAHSATGKPILANDPHLEFSFPSTWYQVHLKAGNLDVTGVSLPGVPGVVIGHNRRIAWGMTNLGYDVQDLYVEKFDPATLRYQFKGQLEQARVEMEVIAVKGAEAQRVQVILTRHGALKVAESGRAMTLRWTASERGSFQFPIIELNLARNWEEFRTALRRYPGPGQNLVYADIDGNIGYQATGLLPRRTSFDGGFPLDGSTGDAEWDGFVPFDELPSVYNPPSGRIVTANQNPWPETTKLRLTGQFASPYRANQIDARLRAKSKWTPTEMLSIQTDIYSPYLHGLSRQVIAAADRAAKKNPSWEVPLNQLRQWDGQVLASSAAPLSAALTHQHFRRMLAEKLLPKRAAEYRDDMAASVVETMLRTRPSGWFTDWDAQLLEAFADAIDEARRMQGRDPSKWRWGNYLEMKIEHPVFTRIPWIGSWYTLQRPGAFSGWFRQTPWLRSWFQDPLEMSGTSTTVKQTTQRLGPSMRFVADLSSWDGSLNNITIGQSGHPLSGHFEDQWKAYLDGTSYPMQYSRIEAKDTLTLTPSR